MTTTIDVTGLKTALFLFFCVIFFPSQHNSVRPQSKVADSKMADKRRKEELDWERKLMIELRSAVEQSFKRDFPRPDPSEHGPNTRGRQAVPNALNRNEMRANFFLPQQIRQGPVLNPQPAQLVSALFD